MREGCNDDHPSFASSCIMYNNNNNGYIGYRVYGYVRGLYKIEYPYSYGYETL